jgi:putative tricarboxylic transport membrane protein
VTSPAPSDDAYLHANPLTTDTSLEEGPVKLTMNKRIDLIGSLALVLLGVFVLIVAYNYPKPTVVFDSIGPMGFPTAIGAFLVIGGLVQSFNTFRYIQKYGMWAPEEGVEDEPEHPSSKWRAVYFMAGSFAFLALLEPLGYLIMLPIGIVAALWSLGYRNWLWRVIVAVSFTIVSFLLFAVVLGVPLPEGPLGDLLVDLGIVDF